MKSRKENFLALVSLILLLYSCTTSDKGNLVGVRGREPFFQPDPYGMVFIPLGSYVMGQNDQDVPYNQLQTAKTVSVQAFYMDETEITNNEYRQFVYWVRDSIARKMLGEQIEDYLITEDQFGQTFDEPYLNWRKRLDWNSDDETVRQVLEELYMPEDERFYRRKEIDPRKLNFRYWWIDYKAAAKKEMQNPIMESDRKYQENPASLINRPQGYKNRSVYIRQDVINVYPDTLCWVHDFTYSFNEPMTKNYFWHPAYDHYPVVGINWKQARAFSIWRTQYMNSYLIHIGQVIVNDFRLPTESEWEWAARGGLDLSPYPWGGPYIRNSNGCFLGNYKPLRGNYPDDGGFHTVIVAHYAPNDYGLYDMAGNVAEWTSNAFDESAYQFAHDLNMDYQYEAKDTDPEVLKRKVVRGGSWKDIGFFMQVSSRTYEFQDTAKSYIGFRNVQTYLGRMKGDGPLSSNVYR
ncbi:MAG: formylglycine-generating enzyme family protein [Bacteroidales bacterium]|nr:formylglycine-generating enzyme family protein [Bacteroidales bacterium]